MMKKKSLIYFTIFTLVFSQTPFPYHYTEAASESLIPDSLVTQTNLSGTLSAIQENPSSPDSNWLTAVSALNTTTANGTFANPVYQLKTGSNLQKVQFHLRKNASGGNAPTTTARVIENNGGTKTVIATQNIVLTDAATLYTVSFDASSLSNKSGANLEWEVTSSPGGGNNTMKRSVEVGAVRLLAENTYIPFGTPPNFSSFEQTKTSISLEWGSSTDAVSYQVKRNGSVIYTGANLSFLDSGLTENTTYTYEVTAYNGTSTSDPSVIQVSTLGSGWLKASGSFDHSLAVKTDGTLWAWGNNDYGELGTGNTTSQTTPVQVGTDTNWKDVDAGDDFSLALKKDGTMWGFGFNTNGELGLSDKTHRYSPTQIGTDTNWKNMSAGGSHSLAVKRDGTLWAWGLNSSCQLGVGNCQVLVGPNQVDTATNWTLASAGQLHSVALKSDGTLWSWGKNAAGQLGLGNTADVAVPTQIGSESSWKSVSAGYTHTLGLKTNGSLWSWGSNTYGQLGLGDTTQRTSPVQIGTGTDWKTLSGGGYYSLATKTNDKLWTWGYNYSGELGHGDNTDRTTPVQMGNDTWKYAFASKFHTLGIKTSGTLWVWGSNVQSKLGLGDVANRNLPVQIKMFGTPENFLSSEQTQTSISVNWDSVVGATSYQLFRNGSSIYQGSDTTFTDTGLTKDTSYTYEVTAFNGTTTSSPASLTLKTLGDGWSKVSVGSGFSVAIKTDGTLWSWGTNYYNQLGLGFSVGAAGKQIPSQIGNDSNWKEVSAGTLHSHAIKTDGTLWGWGYNNNGQLGDGTTNAYNVPVQIGTDTDWTLVAVKSHAFAIKTDGTLWAWGKNDYGRLGLGDTTTRMIPTKVGTDNNWKDVALGDNYSLAIKTDGTLWSWGYNNYGQLGLGDTTTRMIPTKVGTDTNWKEVDAGDDFSLAIKTDGTLWSWGYNNYGQLGLGDTTTRTSPTKVGTDTNWRFVDSGDTHSLVIKTDGTLWSWGYNNYGELGLGDTTTRMIPTKVGTDTQWKNISAGYSHNLAVKNNLTIWSWGYNSSGELGHNDKTTRHTPTKITEADLTAPSEVTNLTETHTSDSVTLNWTNPLDTDFSYIKIYRNGVLIANNLTGTTYHDSGLTSSTTYTYKVTTVDTSGNESTGTTIPATTNAPTPSGSLSVTAPNATSDFGELTVNSSIQPLYSPLSTLTISDTRSTNDGWHVSVSASQFTQTNAINGNPSKTLPINTLMLNGIQNITQTSGSSALPQSLLSTPTIIDNGTISVVHADANEGIGTFDITFPPNAMKLDVDTRSSVIDSSVSTTEYQSTLTWVISAGP